MVFRNEFRGQTTEPLIVRQRFPHPLRTGMIPMRREIPALGLLFVHGGGFQGRQGLESSIGNKLRCPQKLSGFQDHLDYVFVGVLLGRLRRVEGEEEDIHPYGSMHRW